MYGFFHCAIMCVHDIGFCTLYSRRFWVWPTCTKLLVIVQCTIGAAEGVRLRLTADACIPSDRRCLYTVWPQMPLYRLFKLALMYSPLLPASRFRSSLLDEGRKKGKHFEIVYPLGITHSVGSWGRGGGGIREKEIPPVGRGGEGESEKRKFPLFLPLFYPREEADLFCEPKKQCNWLTCFLAVLSKLAFCRSHCLFSFCLYCTSYQYCGSGFGRIWNFFPDPELLFRIRIPLEWQSR